MVNPLRMNNSLHSEPSGILLVDKPKNKTSFSLVAALRRILKVKKIGHAGTLDPFATGVMVMLIGKQFTKLSDKFLGADKEYQATLLLGVETDTYDCDGQILQQNAFVPSNEDLEKALKSFQGDVFQLPPMFSAKKKNGKKLYELARKGISIEREPVKIHLTTELLNYQYPFVELRIRCTKGTYIRSIAHDLGQMLGCGAHLTALKRIRSGLFHIDSCLNGTLLDMPQCDAITIKPFLINDLS